MARPHRLDVTPSGVFHLGLERPSVPGGLLERLWRDSTHFALVRTGAKGLARATALLRGLIEDVWWVSEWPGTRSAGTKVWLRGRATVAPAFPLEAQTLWQGWSGWEDLQLYKGNALHFYVCSHEGFGQVWGSERLFQDLGLQAKRVTSVNPFEIVGSPADPEQLDALKRRF